MEDGVDFLPADKQEIFLQVDSINLGVRSQACPNDANKKLTTSLQYLKKKVSDEVDFLHVDKHESFLHSDTIILMGMFKHSQSFQNIKFAMSSQYLQKKLEMKLTFCMQINIKVSTSWHYCF